MQITAITFMQTDKGTTKKKKDETSQDRRPLFPNLKASTDPQTNAALSHRKKKNRLSFNPPLSLLALLPSCALPGGCAALVPPGWAVRRAHGLWAKLDGPSRRGQENPPVLSPPPSSSPSSLSSKRPGAQKPDKKRTFRTPTWAKYPQTLSSAGAVGQSVVSLPSLNDRIVMSPEIREHKGAGVFGRGQ